MYLNIHLRERNLALIQKKTRILIIICPWNLPLKLELCRNPEGNINSASCNLYIGELYPFNWSVNSIHFSHGEN